MRITLSRLAAAVVAGNGLVSSALAHPGHAATDVAAQVSQPLAGADHLAAFVALTSLLLIALRAALRLRSTARRRPSR